MFIEAFLLLCGVTCAVGECTVIHLLLYDKGDCRITCTRFWLFAHWCVSGEKAALMARLAKLKDAGTDELREKAELQEALVRCVHVCNCAAKKEEVQHQQVM